MILAGSWTNSGLKGFPNFRAMKRTGRKATGCRRARVWEALGSIVHHFIALGRVLLEVALIGVLDAFNTIITHDESQEEWTCMRLESLGLALSRRKLCWYV